MAKYAKAGGFLRKLVGDLVRPAKKWAAKADDAASDMPSNPVNLKKDVASRTRHYQNSTAADFQRTFPELSHGVNPKLRTDPAHQVNCQSCVTATDRSLSGSPSSAVPRPLDANGYPMPDQRFDWPSSVDNALGGNNPIRPASSYDDIATELENAGDGARGIVHGMRQDANGNPIPGHVFNVVNRGGQIHWVDGQIGGYAYLENYNRGFEFMRTN